MLIMKKIVLVALLLNALFSAALYANKNPIGLWRTYDLQGKERSILKFYLVNDELRADVVKILLFEGERCVKCVGENKNKPNLGLTIIQGLKEKEGKWVNGKVLDTRSGNTYGCNIALSDDGKIMYFHAYKGLPLFGRTVHWIREE